MTQPSTEVVRHALEAVAEEMGAVLARAAFSPNIKERRDHSCALFTADTRLVAQAEHIPVHLGAMPLAVEAVLDELGELGPGDVAIVNDPHRGGTHLPDLTMVAPAHQDGRLLGYVTARAHHADVGGKSPGSMPADARSLHEEGLVLPPIRVRREGAWDVEVRELILANTRSPTERAGDLEAQDGALRVGARRLADLAERWGPEGLAAGMDALLDRTRRLLEARLRQAPKGTFQAEETLEAAGPDGSDRTLRVEAELTDDRLHLDYAGTDSQTTGNLNAPLPVTLAGTRYVARVLLDPSIPSNAGFDAVIDVDVPEGTLLNPRPGAAVAGGNVETSQRNVDLLLSALHPAFPDVAPAQSQGTMNNLTLGGTEAGRPFAYYETLGGGEGATPHRDGESGMHTHMTNTRNTPIEAMEAELPVLVRELRLREGSGGAGHHRGGDGIRRVLELLVGDVEANLITTRRRTRPAGANGGEDGEPGRNAIERTDGTEEALAPIARCGLDAGDRLIVETPGGGGWGAPDRDPDR